MSLFLFSPINMRPGPRCGSGSQSLNDKVALLPLVAGEYFLTYLSLHKGFCSPLSRTDSQGLFLYCGALGTAWTVLKPELPVLLVSSGL